MKVKDIIKLYEGLVKLSGEGLKLSAKTSYTLAKNKIALEPLYQAAIEVRQKILMDYGLPDSNGNFRIPVDFLEKANEEFTELMESENEVNLNKIKLKDFGDAPIDFGLIESIMSIIEEE